MNETPGGLELAPTWFRIVLIIVELLTAVGAVGGGVVLIGWAGAAGLPDIGTTRLGTLGLTSWTLGGVALLGAVAVPMAAAAGFAITGHPWTGAVTLLAGSALATWIVFQVAFIGFGSWLQSICLAIGLLVAIGGFALVRAG